MFIVGLVVAIGVSYIGSARDYLAQRSDLHRQEAALAQLREERDAIKTRLKAIELPAVSIARARALGWVEPGELPIRVTGLDEIRKPAPTAPAAGGGFWSWLPAL